MIEVISVEVEVEDVDVVRVEIVEHVVELVEVEAVVVEVDGTSAIEVAFGKFAQLPSLLGRQFTHDLSAFTQAQPLHKPVLLHLQHTIPLGTQLYSGTR